MGHTVPWGGSIQQFESRRDPMLYEGCTYHRLNSVAVHDADDDGGTRHRVAAV